jgi:transcriptional regulator with XRE-family HTH domain
MEDVYMTPFERVKYLSDKQGISINALEERIGLSKNTLYSWKKKTPGVDKLKLVADYFDVSTDYLLGRTNNPVAGLSKKAPFTVEEALASVMSSDGKPLTEHDRKVLTGIIEAYLEKNTDAE